MLNQYASGKNVGITIEIKVKIIANTKGINQIMIKAIHFAHKIQRYLKSFKHLRIRKPTFLLLSALCVCSNKKNNSFLFD